MLNTIAGWEDDSILWDLLKDVVPTEETLLRYDNKVKIITFLI